jgi:hypothetical protein
VPISKHATTPSLDPHELNERTPRTARWLEGSAAPPPEPTRTELWSPSVEAVPPGALSAAEREAKDPDYEEDDRYEPQEVHREAETCDEKDEQKQQ